ncbi:hypothetical protein CC86DRAFT_86478 [Ophiobolus disseminans]|uniref:Uncharacterized protein n=1 Tax=Ophiobolus disseminans TaxID=1469910 RepID=A0A6A7AG71_9PLEO|nr:hypothetical protein CC86DRAFT_86478 [Ophiobolus disseminans]
MLYDIEQRPHWNKEGGESTSIHTHFVHAQGVCRQCSQRHKDTHSGREPGTPPEGQSRGRRWEFGVEDLFWSQQTCVPDYGPISTGSRVVRSARENKTSQLAGEAGLGWAVGVRSVAEGSSTEVPNEVCERVPEVFSAWYTVKAGATAATLDRLHR